MGCMRTPPIEKQTGSDLGFVLGFDELAELFHKTVDVFELTVDRSETHISDFIDVLETIHGVLPDPAGGHFALQRVLQRILNLIDYLFKRVERDGTLFTGAKKTVEQFVAIKGFA